MDDVHCPSFFELAAQDQLRDLLQPVSRYILAVLAQRYPRILLRFANKFDEFYALVSLCVEYHYLKHWGGSFTENFYSLKRRSTPGLRSEKAQSALAVLTKRARLNNRQFYGSLLFLVGIPYVRAKAQDLFDSLGGNLHQHDDLFSDEDALETSAPLTTNEKLKRAYRRVYPYVNTSYEALLLAWNVAYIFSKTEFYRPWYQLLRVDVRRMSAEDLNHVPTAPTSPSRKLLHYALESLRYILPGSILLFKFMEWWYSSSIRSASKAFSTTVQPLLKPPAKTIPSKDVEAPAKGQCAVCRQATVNATALTTSGWVCCYRCALNYVSQHGKCPVTGILTTTGDLRKLVG